MFVFPELDVDNKHLEEPHRPSQVDKTEADSNDFLWANQMAR